MKTRVALMGIGFVLGAAIAIGLACVIGLANGLRAWLGIGLLIVVVVLWGAHGSTQSGGESQISDLTFKKPNCAEPAAARPALPIVEVVPDYWREQAEKNMKAAEPYSSDPAQAMRDEINRRSGISKTR